VLSLPLLLLIASRPGQLCLRHAKVEEAG
jgi:hypothetical protein